jgi:hypothetical protein
MPQNVADADTWTATVQCAADGEAVDGASQLLPAQDLSDRTRRLYNRSIETVGGDLLVPLNVVSLFPAGGAARWAWEVVGAVYRGWLVNSSVAGVDECLIALPTLHNCTFNSVAMIIDGDAGSGGAHAGWPPAVFPRITLIGVDSSTSTSTNIGNAVDAPANQAAYEVSHAVTLAVAAQTMDEDHAYYVSIRGENGGAAQANSLALMGCQMTVVPA